MTGSVHAALGAAVGRYVKNKPLAFGADPARDAVLDEAAFMSASLWPEVVRPMLLERRGGAAFLSTPYGHNHFWELYKLGLDDPTGQWKSFRVAGENSWLDSRRL